MSRAFVVARFPQRFPSTSVRPRDTERYCERSMDRPDSVEKSQAVVANSAAQAPVSWETPNTEGIGVRRLPLIIATLGLLGLLIVAVTLMLDV